MSMLSANQITHIFLCKRDPRFCNEAISVACAGILAKAYNVTYETIQDIWNGCIWSGITNAVSRPSGNPKRKRASVGPDSIDDVLYDWEAYPWRKLDLTSFNDPFSRDLYALATMF